MTYIDLKLELLIINIKTIIYFSLFINPYQYNDQMIVDIINYELYVQIFIIIITIYFYIFIYFFIDPVFSFLFSLA